ncbi:hypothetical protein [Streptomyces sp. NPDC058718]|uniref:hypothetical protein n=1 Tax=Streptomyces sp. NPDC058718 TaxID=3346610 RepID=UPI0036763AF2
MALCGSCERAGEEHPAREPVLVGDVLAGLTEAVTHAAGSGRPAPIGSPVLLALQRGPAGRAT